MRHGGGADLLVRIECLGHLGDLAALQVAYLLQDLLDAGGDVCHPGNPFDVAVATDDLGGHQRNPKVEVGEYECLEFAGLVTLCCTSAHRAEELAYTHPRGHLDQSDEVSTELVHPDGHLQAERDRCGGLAVRAAEHDGVPLPLCEVAQSADQFLDALHLL